MPPDLRAGRLAQITNIKRKRRNIVVRRDDGTLQEIDLAQYPHVRPARVISLREALLVPRDARLLIRLTRARHAWACILAAAAHGTHAIVEVFAQHHSITASAQLDGRADFLELS